MSEIEYVLYRTSGFKDYSVGNKGPLATRVLPAQVGSKMDFRSEGFHVFEKAHGLVSVMEQHTHMLRSDEDSSVHSVTGSISDQGSLSSHSVFIDFKMKRIFTQYRSLKKAFRLPFMILQATQVALHPFLIVFDGRYNLKKFSFPEGDLSELKGK
ncbi:hypothetical protein EON65_17230 [archaeon]|nr:MAG: hypothetical protein EON65_17230 [archaeon]